MKLFLLFRCAGAGVPSAEEAGLGRGSLRLRRARQSLREQPGESGGADVARAVLGLR